MITFSLKLTISALAALALAIPATARHTIDLSGRWDFGFANDSLTRSVTLPGTLDTNGIGLPVQSDNNTTGLSREKHYEGPAFYQRHVDIPKGWRGSHITLTLGRTRPSTIWIDGKRASSCTFLSAPHVYDLSELLTPGRHSIMIMVDNGDSIPAQIRSNSHACAEATQTNWNGITGDIRLTSAPALHISTIKAVPDITTHSFNVKVSLSQSPRKKGNLSVKCGDTTVKIKTKPGIKDYDVNIAPGDSPQLWSDLHPALNTIEAMIPGVDTLSVNAGLRKFEAAGRQFAINGRTTFLRGRHDACVFPLTGFAPTDVESWREYFRTIKSYGLNHVRFHSWCPPEACFDAADIEGVYLQPELPIWGTLNRDEPRLIEFLKADGGAIMKAYGNHPSFVMFALGNELFGDKEVMRELTDYFRGIDGDRLYALGSNSFLGWEGNLAGQDFSVTCRVGGGNGYETHTRASFSFADADEGGYLNNTYPNTLMDFEGAVRRSDVPVVGHETGQYQIYPRYEEIEKYTGILKPVNLEIFRRRLAEAGMADRAHDFFEASGKWAVELYKADMEMNLRTPSMAGFQLLDIQDYPGQGTALVGILDAFMDSKGLVSPAEWRRSCAPVVALAQFPSYCLTSGENVNIKFKVANYGDASLEGKTLQWRLSDSGRTVASGSAPVGKDFGLLDVDSVSVKIPVNIEPYPLNLELDIPGTDVSNRYSLWAYPAGKEIDYGRASLVRDIDDNLFRRLERGEKILLAPKREAVDSVTVGGLFQTDYWNYRMFRTICENAKRPVSPGTLGIVNDPNHPALSAFPNSGHTDWQWYSIVKNSYPLILDALNKTGYTPVIQVIDNIERNHRLGLLSEFSVGKGKLMILMADTDRLQESVEGRQFLRSIGKYMNGDSFAPTHNLTPEALRGLFTPTGASSSINELRNISYD